MQEQICQEKRTQIFVALDDFVLLFEHWLAQRTLPQPPKPTRQPELTASESITLLMYYHHSGYKNFQYFYQRLVPPQMRSYFPR